MAAKNGDDELLPPNIDWYGVCNKQNISKTRIENEDQEMDKSSVRIHSRSKRGVFAALGAFMLLKDTYEYVMGIAAPSKSQDEYFKETLQGIKQNYDAINRNYNAIQNIERKVDRNFHTLNMVFELVSSTLSAIEKTRIDILQKMRNTEINYIILHLNLKIDHFNTEMKIIESLSEKEHIDKLLANEGLLKDLRDTRTPNKDSLHTYLHNIIFQGHAIPETVNDKEAFSALNALYYGTRTYASVMFFLLEQYSYIADYYYRSDEIDKFNEYFNHIVSCFDDFKQSIVIPDDSKKESLINHVINTLITVRNKNFIRYTREISSELSEVIESLITIRHELQVMELPVMRDEPGKILGNLEFVQPEILTPIGEWRDGVQVSYAIQYRNKAIYSKVGKWSDPFTVTDKANPILRIPTNVKSGKSRVILRKINNANVQIVGVLENEVETNFRDIDKDVYNAVLSYDKDKAIKEVKIYVENGANINAVFDNGRRAIHAAAQRDNTQLAKNFFINNSVIDMLNVKDSDGFTPMHVAVAAGHDTFLKWLIESGGNVNERTYSDELTPLHIAAYKGFKPTVEALMRSNQIDFNAQDKKGFTPLHNAVFAGFHVVQTLISNENVDINAKSNTGLTPLHMSSIENFPKVTETLAKSNKLDANAKALGNFTALHFASMFGHIEIVKLLIDKNKIDINAQSVSNWTALHLAISLKKENVVAELLKVNSINVNIPIGSNITALHLAAITGQNNVITNLLEKHVEVEAKTSDGLTALHLAVMQGYHEIVSTLIDSGANIEAKTVSGLTPLLLAASSKNTTAEVMKSLLERGANLTAVAPNGESYPWIAPKRGNSDVVNFIISDDKDYGVQDVNGNYFLHFAALGGNFDVVKYLIQEKQHFVDVKNFNKETPLHFAAESGNLDLVQYLIEKERANINSANKQQMTPSYFAVKNGNSNIYVYLVEKRNARANSELVYFAAENGRLDLFKYLFEKKNMKVGAYGRHFNTFLHFAAKSGNLQLVKYLVEEKKANIFAKNMYNQYPLNLGYESGNMELVRYLAEKTLGHVKYNRINARNEYGKRAIHYAIRSSNLELLKYLVNLGAANEPDKIPLHFAIESANIDIVKYLLSIGANLNSKGYENRTPLHIAIMRNDLDIVHCLLEKGKIDVTVKDKFNITPLHLAAQVNLDVVKYLLEKGADINAKRQGELCSTPLCFAIKVGDFEIVKYLIKKGANINDAVNPEFVSVDLVNNNINNLDTLHFAVSMNNSNVVKYLVQEGAKPHKPLLNGFLLLVTAAMRSNFDLVQYFVQKGSDFRGHSDKYPLLHVAAKAGSLNIVKYLIDKGLNVNVEDFHGKTTLHPAAESGTVDLVKYLIEMEDMDPNVKDKLGNTPLQGAIENGKLETVKYLMEKTDANINDTNDVKYSLLHSAAVSGNLNLVKYLTDRGAYVNAKSLSGNTPLHLASDNFYFGIVKYLIKKNANINALNQDHEKPVQKALSHPRALSRYTATSYTRLLQYLTVRYLVELEADASIKDLESRAAASDLKEIKTFLSDYKLTVNVRDAIKEGNLDIIEYSIFYGANLGFRDKNGSTLLHIAAEKGQLDVAKLLVNKGANLYAQDEKNKTPSDIATDKRNYKLVRYFENEKLSTENRYRKRDIAQQLKYNSIQLSRHNTEKGLSSSKKSSIRGYTEINVASGANKPFSLISVFVTILLNSVKSITSFNYFFKPTISVQYCETCTSVRDENINTNSTLFLLDLIIKKITCQKYIYTADTSISLAEANGYALDIVCLFERAVRQAALYSKISLHRLNIDFVEVQKDCIGKVLGNKFYEINEVLKLYMVRACPGRAANCSGKISMKTFNKFTDEFNKVLHVTMSQWMQDTLQNKIMTEPAMEVNGQRLGFEYKKSLNNTRITYV